MTSSSSVAARSLERKAASALLSLSAQPAHINCVSVSRVNARPRYRQQLRRILGKSERRRRGARRRREEGLILPSSSPPPSEESSWPSSGHLLNPDNAVVGAAVNGGERADRTPLLPRASSALRALGQRELCDNLCAATAATTATKKLPCPARLPLNSPRLPLNSQGPCLLYSCTVPLQD